MKNLNGVEGDATREPFGDCPDWCDRTAHMRGGHSSSRVFAGLLVSVVQFPGDDPAVFVNALGGAVEDERDSAPVGTIPAGHVLGLLAAVARSEREPRSRAEWLAPRGGLVEAYRRPGGGMELHHRIGREVVSMMPLPGVLDDVAAELGRVYAERVGGLYVPLPEPDGAVRFFSCALGYVEARTVRIVLDFDGTEMVLSIEQAITAADVLLAQDREDSLPELLDFADALVSAVRFVATCYPAVLA
ncbi:hypothetical protein GCM10022221_18300 [Actinocorallia aurea]